MRAAVSAGLAVDVADAAGVDVAAPAAPKEPNEGGAAAAVVVAGVAAAGAGLKSERKIF